MGGMKFADRNEVRDNFLKFDYKIPTEQDYGARLKKRTFNNYEKNYITKKEIKVLKERFVEKLKVEEELNYTAHSSKKKGKEVVQSQPIYVK